MKFPKSINTNTAWRTMSAFALSLALATGCASTTDGDLSDEEIEAIQDDLDIIFSTPEQEAVYDDCMDTMEEGGATYRSAHKHCKRRALSEA